MTLAPAPLHQGLADAPSDARAFWVTAEDGVRLRLMMADAAAGTANRGTVLVFPGRTEPVEKYGPTARVLARAGYASLCIDWRGQGLADRALADPMMGHVAGFGDYQADVRALVQAANDLGLAQPWFLLAHSMGGAIGLRALMRMPGLVRAAAFSAPMWGIKMAAPLRPVARQIGQIAVALGQGNRYAPTTSAASYVATAAFEGNTLTRDEPMFHWMQAQVRAERALSLGGPSLAWLTHALTECAEMARQPSPLVPCFCGLGAAEMVVEPAAIRDRMARWPSSRLEVFPDAEHELLMERPATRDRFYDQMFAHFDAHR